MGLLNENYDVPTVPVAQVYRVRISNGFLSQHNVDVYKAVISSQIIETTSRDTIARMVAAEFINRGDTKEIARRLKVSDVSEYRVELETFTDSSNDTIYQLRAISDNDISVLTCFDIIKRN